ncbi:oxygenase MpaB family protein [Streptomyces sp. BHT-5-2]|uniref:oxygenase MpaB family protein n=1 Tax=Streptomyces sp. BHT-5-2 TaxID=2866715 RepID=UPI001C8EDCEF|nr:oxygenase MpaB family protein [Streptomyces sp. BHT-5-2]QZL05078.1 oxygenase MpaB family protein [Streptomyces sp. BHT-5-2]
MSTALSGPDSLLRRTLGEQRIALVAWRLLVLQSADPAVGAGMAEFSTYRAHPWRRMQHTMDSGRRLFFGDREELRREIARLERTHRRIRGTDGQGREFSALDPTVRVWVLMTLYESMTAMCELSGAPLGAAERDQLYAEFRLVCKEFGLPAELFPRTAAQVPAYVERTIRDRLEYTEAAHDLLFQMLHQAPPPRRLGRLRPAWPLLRPVIARMLTALTLADLPPAFRERFGLRRSRSAAALSWLLHHGSRHLVTRLPDRLRYHNRTTAQQAAQPAAEPARAAPHGDGDGAAARAGRLPKPRRAGRDTARRARVEAFFRQVLDQTGDGHLTAADLQAMAHNVCWQLELDESREAEVYAGFDTWWQHIRSTMDTDGDDRVSLGEFTTAMLAGIDRDPDYLHQGLHTALRALFRAVDTDGSGLLGPDEYRVVFGGSRVHPAELNHGFRQLDADGDGQITEEEFLRAFTDYFTARADTVAGTQLLGRP